MIWFASWIMTEDGFSGWMGGWMLVLMIRLVHLALLLSDDHDDDDHDEVGMKHRHTIFSSALDWIDGIIAPDAIYSQKIVLSP